MSRARRGILRWTERVLFATGLALLGYWGFSTFDSWRFQRTEDRMLSAVAYERPPATREAAETPGAASVSDMPEDSSDESGVLAAGGYPERGGLVGRIEIPRLGMSVMVMEGSDSGTLSRAAGHIEGTALPGETGNVGISAHRDSLFRPLKDIRRNDVVRITTPAGKYRYRVVSTKVVDPADTSVLDSGEGESLTLITCYPFRFIGPAPGRFIVTAERDLAAR